MQRKARYRYGLSSKAFAGSIALLLVYFSLLRPILDAPQALLAFAEVESFPRNDSSIPSSPTKDTNGFMNFRSDDSKSHAGLWICGESFMEGMAGWTVSFSNVLAMSTALDANMIEPMIFQARLFGACGTLTTATTQKNVASRRVAFSEVFDVKHLKTHFGNLVSHHEFSNALLNNQQPPQYFDICLNSLKQATCENGMASRAGIIFDEALDAAVNASKTDMVVLRLHDVWKTSMDRMRLTRNPDQLVLDRSMARKVTSNLKFHPEMYRLADKVAYNLNSSISAGSPSSGLAVIHWRAENPSLDYRECAERLVHTKEVIMNQSQQNQGLQFVLMSSLSSHSNLTWGTTNKHAHNTNAREALNWLIQENQFAKIDHMPWMQQLPDAVFYLVLDLILAERARVFATCNDKCKSHELCNPCSYLGNFAKFALQHRKKHSRRRKDHATFHCWPNK